MTDREKVIKGIECCTIRNICGSDCPYFKEAQMTDGRCIMALQADTLSLLKEKEPVEPEVEVLNEIDRLYRCPKCHKCFFYEKQKYCDQCGQAVKW